MTNAFDRIKKKKRPKVSKRTDPLNDTNHKSTQLETASIESLDLTTSSATETTEETEIQSNSQQLVSITNNINSKLLEFKTVSASWRIHPEVKQGLDALIKAKNSAESVKITKDTFVEAAIFICQQNPQILASVLDEAKTRQEYRNKAGAYKRSQSILQKLNENNTLD